MCCSIPTAWASSGGIKAHYIKIASIKTSIKTQHKEPVYKHYKNTQDKGTA